MAGEPTAKPLFPAAHGAGAASIGLVAATYPGVWSVTHIDTGLWSDTVGRKPLILAGMLLQAAALAGLAVSNGCIASAAATAVLLGLGASLVYPTLIAAMSDAVTPVARALVVGVYRFWRDMGYAIGALSAGPAADALGHGQAIAFVAALTAVSGLWVLGDMPDDRSDRERSGAHGAGLNRQSGGAPRLKPAEQVGRKREPDVLQCRGRQARLIALVADQDDAAMERVAELRRVRRPPWWRLRPTRAVWDGSVADGAQERAQERGFSLLGGNPGGVQFRAGGVDERHEH
jgi:MFS family permease